MELFADPSNDRALDAIRDELVDRLSRFTALRYPESPLDPHETALETMIVVDWKWRYGDGHLDQWSTRDAMAFLFEWCPRKLSVPAVESGFALEAVIRWIDFLAIEGLFERVHETSEEIVTAIERARPAFALAMADSSLFSPGKSIVMGAVELGVDLSDKEALSEFVAQYNNRIMLDAAHTIDDDSRGGRGFARKLPPVIQPNDADVAASISAVPVLAMFRDLAAFVGPGRKLTQNGNLTLADARELVKILQTGDPIDPEANGTVNRIRSSTDLRVLDAVFVWAKKAGFVRVLHGKLVATKRGVALKRDLAGQFDRAVTALMELGPCSIYLRHHEESSWTQLGAIVDSLSIDLLALAYATSGPVELATVAQFGGDMVVAGWSVNFNEEMLRSWVSDCVTAVIDSFALCGLVRREGDIQNHPWRRSEGGVVTVTPAGNVGARRLINEAGFETPVLGELVGLSAHELLRTIDYDEFEYAYRETVAWFSARDPDGAMDELMAALMKLEEPGMENFVMSMLGELDPVQAPARLQSLRSNPQFAGSAAFWMRLYDFIEESELYDPALPFDFISVLILRLINDGPEALLSTLALVGNDLEQATYLDTVWRAPTRATTPVLATVADLHPNKKVSKAARKSLFKRESAKLA